MRHLPCCSRSPFRASILLFAIAALAGCAGKESKPAVVVKEAPPQTTIAIDTRQITVLPPHFFGYDADIAGSSLSYANRRVPKALESLHPGSLTFPGSSVANVWEWLPGLVRDAWVAQLPTSGTQGQVPLRGLLEQAAETNLIKGGSSLRSFLDVTRRLDAEPICTANVLHQTPADSVQWLKTAASLGQPVRQWELGQELWKPEYRQRIASPEAYIALARSHADALRAADPNVRIAVGIPAEALLLPEPKAQAAVTTKTAVTKVKPAKRSSKRSHHSAAKIPPVAKVEEKPTTQSLEAAFLRSWVAQMALQTFYDGVALDLNFALRAAPGTTPEYMQYAICRQARDRIETTLNKHVDWFRNREIWVSEWSVKVENSPEFAGSLLHGLALANISIALANQIPQVKRLCYSNMIEAAGLSNGEEIRATMIDQFRQTGKLPKSAGTKPRFDNTTPSAYVLRMLGDLFAGCDRKAAVEIYQPPLLTPTNTSVGATTVALQDGPGKKEELPAAVTAMALLSPDGFLRIAAINHSKEPQVVRLVVNNFQMGGKLRALVLSGKTLMPAKSVNGDAAPREVPEPRTEDWDASDLVLPPYSFSVLESRI